MDYLVSHHIRGFVLTSSYGMHGWVMAQIMSIKPGRKPD
jgi:hypothetical protein